MTKRTNKPKTTSKQAPQASTEAIESVEAKTNTSVAKRPKKANSTTTGTSKRTRSKKTTATKESDVVKVPIQATLEMEVTYVDPKLMSKITAPVKEESKPSLYDRFVGWLFRITLPFRGY